MLSYGDEPVREQVMEGKEITLKEILEVTDKTLWDADAILTTIIGGILGGNDPDKTTTDPVCMKDQVQLLQIAAEKILKKAQIIKVNMF